MTDPAHWTLSPEALGHFLLLLDADIVEAGHKYERLRAKLIRLFEWRGCSFAEDLADESLNRVIRRLEQGLDLGAGDVPRFSAGVAHRVFLEHLRELRRQPRPTNAERARFAPNRHETTDLRLVCLEQSLERLPSTEKDLVLRYYAGSSATRIRNRKTLANEMGIAANTLRIRVFRIRSKLERWIGDRMRPVAEGSSGPPKHHEVAPTSSLDPGDRQP